MTATYNVITAAILTSERRRWISESDAEQIAQDVDTALSSSGAFDAAADAERIEDEKARKAHALELFAWLAERTDEIHVARLESDEGKGVNITTDAHVEQWLDDMASVWIEEEL